MAFFFNRQVPSALSFLALLLIHGCGSDTRPAHRIVDDSEIVEQKIRMAEFNCVGPCKPGVGLLLATDVPSEGYTGLSACTAFQISADLVMTNSHCIPDDLKAASSNCSSRIHFLIPAASGTIVRVGCAQVLEASTLSSAHRGPEIHRQKDYAILKLDRSLTGRGQWLALNTARIDLDFSSDSRTSIDRAFNQATIIEVTPSLGQTYSGTQEIEPCLDAYHRPGYPGHSLGFLNCASENGNSGSPILDSSSRVRAILYAGSNSRSSSGVAIACITSTVFGPLDHAMPPECN